MPKKPHPTSGATGSDTPDDLAIEPTGTLELTWRGKNATLLAVDEGRSYRWLDPKDYRVNEVRLLRDVPEYGKVGATHPDSQRAKDNLLIRGDALHALNSLSRLPEFAKEYRGKVKLVYIDPPFNTGRAFNQYDDALEHSIWLTMMRDRLIQIRDLLHPDGTVWVHLDSVEAHYARVVLDEIFGAKSHVATVAWRSTDNSNNSAGQFSEDHNQIHVYAKKPEWRSRRLPDADKQSHYRNPDNDPRGPWFDGNPLGSPKRNPRNMYTLTSPQGHSIKPPTNGWRWTQDSMHERIESGEIRFTEDGRAVKRRTYLNEQEGLPPSDIWFDVDQTGSNRQAKYELKALFPGVHTDDLFDTPKPERLLKRILELTTLPGDIVLDCFAGSGTTAAVAHKLGRRWVTVEWSEDTLARFTEPRLRKVVAGEDLGGVSRSQTRAPAEQTRPEMCTPHDAKVALAVLDAVASETGNAGTSSEPLSTIRERLKVLAKTVAVEETLWPGGGGFRVLDVGESMYAVDDQGDLYLADWVAGDALAEAVCAQKDFGFVYEKDGIFCGQKNSLRLAVVDGLVTQQVIDEIVAALPDGQRVNVAGTAIAPDVARGGRVTKIRAIPASLVAEHERSSALRKALARQRELEARARADAEHEAAADRKKALSADGKGGEASLFAEGES